MKKLIIAAAIVCAAVVSQAAAVGWSSMGASGDFKGGDYSVFVLGMNGVKADASQAAAQIKAIVEAGGLSAADSYAFYTGGEVASNGAATLGTDKSGKTITYSGSGTDTYTAFLVLEDVNGAYATYSGTKNIELTNDSTPKTWTFSNQATNYTNNKFAVAPEPTSGLLLLLGVAGLALKRRRA